MPPANSRFFFRAQFQAEWGVGAGNHEGNAEAPRTPLPVPQPDDREHELSPIGQQLQRQARDLVKLWRTEEEIDKDDESLHVLEAEEAADSTVAKIKDRESLEQLIRGTKRLNTYCKDPKTPACTSFWPAPRHFKGMDGTPLSFEPPFSTPSEVRAKYEGEAKPKNEFEEFLAKNRALREGQQCFEEKTKRNSFNTLLESVKTGNAPNNATPAKWSVYIESEVQSVMALFDLLDKQDQAEEILARGLPDTIDDSPIASPTPSIKHLPKNSQSGEVGEYEIASPMSSIKRVPRYFNLQGLIVKEETRSNSGDENVNLNSLLEKEETRAKPSHNEDESEKGSEKDDSSVEGSEKDEIAQATPNSSSDRASDEEEEWELV